MTSCEASVGDDCAIDVATSSKLFLRILKALQTILLIETGKGIRKMGNTSKDKVKQTYLIISPYPSP
uniref:Uncharacterized protein n=2 Tax=Oryza TaxID=4527 RepID=A0A0D3GQW5_9ORYZ